MLKKLIFLAIFFVSCNLFAVDYFFGDYIYIGTQHCTIDIDDDYEMTVEYFDVQNQRKIEYEGKYRVIGNEIQFTAFSKEIETYKIFNLERKVIGVWTFTFKIEPLDINHVNIESSSNEIPTGKYFRKIDF